MAKIDITKTELVDRQVQRGRHAQGGAVREPALPGHRNHQREPRNARGAHPQGARPGKRRHAEGIISREARG